MSNLSRESINALAERWADIVWAISWQFCVLGVVVLLINWLLRRAAPNWRYWLWQILAIKLLLMPFWTAALPWPKTIPDSGPKIESTVAKSPDLKSPAVSQTSKKTSAPLVVSAPSKPPLDPVTVPELFEPVLSSPSIQPVELDGKAESHTEQVQIKRDREQPILVAPAALDVLPDSNASIVDEPALPTSTKAAMPWQSWLLLAWSLGVIWYVLRIVWQGIALSRRLRTAQSAEAVLLQRVLAAAEKLKLSRVPRVLILDADISPFVCGIWRNKLVLPRAVTETFTPEQLDLVLLHELAHIYRRDLIWGWISEIGRVLFFFHPLVYVVCNQIRFERELACDQLAMLSSGRDAATYADTLVRVVGQFSSGRESLKLVVTDSP